MLNKCKPTYMLSIFLLFALTGVMFADTEISDCATLSSPGNYLLNQSIPAASSSCITINVSDVTLDCQGNTITYSGSATDRLITTLFEISNVSILNCNLVKGTIVNNNPVHFLLIQNVNITSTYATTLNAYNVTMDNAWMNMTGQAALRPWVLYYGVIENSTFISNASAAIDFYRSEGGVNLTNNTFIGTTSSVQISSGSNNRFALNNFSCFGECTLYVNDTAGSNYYNNTVNGVNQGNIYANVIDGTVDIKGKDESSVPDLYIGKAGSGYPYNSTTSGGKVTSNVVDWAPLTPTQGLVCGNLNEAGITYNLSFDISANETCFTIQANDITLDCNGFSITGDGSMNYYGIYAESVSNITIQNCTIHDFSEGIYFSYYTSDSKILNNIIYNCTYDGMYLEESSAINCTNNLVYENQFSGIYIYRTTNSVFENNTAHSTVGDRGVGAGFYIEGSDSNIFINNINELNYSGTDQKFYSDSAQNTSSSGNLGWWPLLGSNGSDVGSQDYTAWYNGTSGGRNYDGSANASLLYWYGNNPFPTILSSRISPAIPYPSDTLEGFCTGVSFTSPTLLYYYNWFLNGIENQSGTTELFASGDEINVGNISGDEVNLGQEWVLQCIASDETYNSTALNSSVALVNFCVGETQNFSCGDTVTESCTMSGRMSASASDCFDIYSNDITIDCNGSSIGGDGTSNGIYAESASNVTVQNCTIHNFQKGIYFSGTANTYILNSNIRACSSDGIYIEDSSAVNCSNNLLYNNSYSFDTHTVYDSVFENNTVYGTYSDAGFYLYYTENSTFANNAVYNHSYGGFYLSGGGNNLFINNTNALDYDGSYYSMFYSDSPQNISSYNNTGWWPLQRSDGSDATDQTYTAWYNGTSGGRNADGTPNPYLTYWYTEGPSCASSSQNFTCGDNVTENCIMNGNLSMRGGNCFSIVDENITIDCNGYSITGDNTDRTAGVYITGPGGNTVKNCFITRFETGISLYSTSNNQILNNTAYANFRPGGRWPPSPPSGNGFYIYSAENNTFANNTADSNYKYGFPIGLSSGNTFTNNVARNNSWGGFQISGDNNLFINNTNELVYDGTDQMFYSDSSQDAASGGNMGWWPLIASDGSDAYYQEYTAWYNGTSGGRDADGTPNPVLKYWYNNQPLPGTCIGETQSFVCGETVNETCTVVGTMVINGSTCLRVGANNIAINCNGNSITGNNTFFTYGIYSNKSNTTVRNCIIRRFDAGIYINNTGRALLEGNTINVSTRNVEVSPYSSGILIYSGSGYNSLINNTAYSQYGNAIYLYLSSRNNITNCIASSDGARGIFLTSSSSNNIVDSTGTSATNHGLRLQLSNNNNILNSNATSGSSYALYILSSANNNVFTNSTFSSGTNTGVRIVSASNNRFVNSVNTLGYSGKLQKFYSNLAQDASSYGNTGWWPLLNSSGSDATVQSRTAWYNGSMGGRNADGSFNMYIHYWKENGTFPSCVGANNNFTCGQTVTESCTLDGNVSITGATCFTIGADNVTLDCNGSSITGYETGNYGIYSTRYNTTAKNCIISGFNSGIYYYEVTDGTIENSIINSTGAGYGISIASSPNSTIINSTIASDSGVGIYLLTSSGSTIINSTSASNSSYGIELVSSPNSTIINSAGTSSSSSGVLVSGSNNNRIINFTGSSNSIYGIFLDSSSNNVITNSTGTSISGTGIFLDSSSNNVITNPTGTSNFSYGIYIEWSSNNTISNSYGTSNSADGFYLYYSSNNTIAGSTGVSSSGRGVYVRYSPGNTIIHSTGITNGTSYTGIETVSSSNLQLINFTGIAPLGYGIFLGSSTNNTLTDCYGISDSEVGIEVQCSNSTITNSYGISSSYAGVYISGSNNKIFNDSGISTSGPGAYFYFGRNNTIVNSTFISTSGPGATIFYWSNNNITNSIFTSNSSSGFNSSSYDESQNNSFTNSIFTSDSSYAIYLYNNAYNTFTNSTFISHSSRGIYLTSNSANNLFVNCINSIDYNGTSQKFYSGSAQNVSSYGNTGWWPRLSSSGSDAFSQANTAWYNGTSGGRNADGSANSSLHYWYNNQGPASSAAACIGATQTFVCGQTITESCTMNGSLSINGPTCFTIGADNVEVDCNGSLITGNNASANGIYASGRTNITVKNCIISNFSDSIYFMDTTNGMINSTTSATTYSSGKGIYFLRTNNSVIANSTGLSNSGYGVYLDSSPNTTLIDSQGISNSNRGIYSYYSNNSIISDSTGTSNSSHGIYLGSSSNNIISDSTGTSDSSSGIYLGSSSNNTITGSTFTCYNSYYGMVLDDSNHNRITNSVTSINAGIALFSSHNNTIANLTSVADIGLGIALFSSHNNTISDSSFTANSSYGIYATTANNNLFINCINSIDYNGTDLRFYSDRSSHSTSSLGNTGWWPLLDSNGSDVATQNMTAWYNGSAGGRNADGTENLSLQYWYNNNGAISCVGATQAFMCGDTITESCTMNGNLSINSSTCFTIGADNITIDCNGYSLTGNGVDGTQGIYLERRSNVTIRNCSIHNFGDNVLLNLSTNSTIADNYVYDSYATGIYLMNLSTGNNISYNHLISNDGIGLKLYRNSHNNTIIGNVITDSNHQGIYIHNSTQNLVMDNYVSSRDEVDSMSLLLLYSYENTFINSTFVTYSNETTDYGIQLLVRSSNNLFINCTNAMDYAFTASQKFSADSTSGSNISSYGNVGWWPLVSSNGSDATTQNMTAWYDATSGGRNANGSANSSLLYWYGNNFATGCVGATQIFVCGQTVTESCTMNRNVSINSSTCFTIGADNITIDCNGFSITGDASGGTYGILSRSRQNITIANCVINRFQDGINFTSTVNSRILNNSMHDHYDVGVRLSGSSGNLVSNNALLASGGYAVQVGYASENNTIEGNLLNNSHYGGIYFVESSGNTAENNTISNHLYDALLFVDASYNSIINNTLSNGTISISMYSSPDNLFIHNANELTYGGSAAKFYSDSPQNTSSNSNIGWWPLLNSSGGDADNQTRTAWYNGSMGGRNADGSANASLSYWYGNNGPQAACVGANYKFVCGETINESCTMHGDLAIDGTTCLRVGTNNIEIDCNGNSITGNNTLFTYGIYSNKSGTTVRNCIISGFDAGIYINSTGAALLESNTINVSTNNVVVSPYSSGILIYSGSGYNSLINNTAYSQYGNAIYLYSSSRNNITNCTASSYGARGIFLTSSSNNNILDSSGYSNTNHGLRLQLSNNNIITNSNGTSNTSYGLYLVSASNNVFTGSTSSSNKNTALRIASASNNLFTDCINSISYSGKVQMFYSNYAQNIASSGNTGWWPLLNSSGSDTITQSKTAWYNGSMGGRNADGSANSSLQYWYGNQTGPA